MAGRDPVLYDVMMAWRAAAGYWMAAHRGRTAFL